MRIFDKLSKEEWLEIRKGIITATEASALLKLDKWAKVSDIIKEKENPSFTGNAYTWVGSQLERVVVEAVNTMLDRRFRLFDTVDGKTIYVNEELKLGATPDATDEEVLLECKTTGKRNWYSWSNIPPLKYVCQLQVQLCCCGYKEGVLAILCTDLQQTSRELRLKLSTFKIVKCNRFESLLKRKVEDFWEKGADKYRISSTDSSLAKLLLLGSVTKES
jgi:predicted phage-related endonuclease